MDGESASSLGLTGKESFTIDMIATSSQGQKVTVTATTSFGNRISFETISRIDTLIEMEYYRDGGILLTVLTMLLKDDKWTG